MAYGICVWVPDPETGGIKVATRFPCSSCGELFEEIHIINDDIQLCENDNNHLKFMEEYYRD